MKRTTLAVLKLGAAQAVLGIALHGTAALAQDAGAGVAPDDATIVVTGTRLPAAQPPVPVVSISPRELLQTGKVAIGDTLNDLPSLHTSFGQGSNTSAVGINGLNLLDLRGLGPGRTLVLVNGRRHVGSDLLANGVSVDINTIPTDLIKRVDILTGGNSAVYGSDAIAGVVNFVLDDAFEGARFSAQAGISDEADAPQQRLTLTLGQNFAGGRGNIAVSGEYTNQAPFYASQRENLSSATQLVQVENDPGAVGIADRQFFNDVRSTTFAPGGLTNFASHQCGKDPAGAYYDCTYLFQPNGTLVPQTGQRVGLGPNGSFIGGNGSNGREGESLGLISKTERVGVNLIGHLDVSSALTAFVEAKYYRVDSQSTGAGPMPIQGTTLLVYGGDSRERPRLDNPFLSDQARTLIRQQLAAAAGVSPDLIPLTTRFNLKESLIDLGQRSEESRRETYRIVGGFRGDLSDHLSYEVSANYGEMRERTITHNDIYVQRLLLAMDAATNSAGQIVCRSQIDSTAARSTANPYAAAQLASDIAACVPVNLFGQGNISQAARNYLLTDTTSTGKITQFDTLGYVRGDSGGFFNLPGGPVGFVAGTEYRRETNEMQQDKLVQEFLTTATPLPSFAFPAFHVTEFFGELRLPLLAHLPAIRSLTLTASGRISDFGGSIKTAKTYNLNAEYSPFGGLVFHGGYGRAFRTPAMSDLLTPQSLVPAANFADPCAARNRTGNRIANCAAAGIPDSYDPANSTLFYKIGGNPQLDPEFSNSWTFGGTLTPRQVRGLSVSAEYYDIEIVNALQSATAQAIVNDCYDLPSLNNPFCARIQRNTTGTVLATGEQPYQIIQGSLLSSVVNSVRAKVRGIDFDVAYSHPTAFGSVRSRLLWTHEFENRIYSNPLTPDVANDLLEESGEPVDSFNWSFGADIGKLQIDYELRYIGKTTIVGNAIENVQSTNGNPPADADYAANPFYPAVWYHNIRVGCDVTRQLNLYVGVDNLFDKQPPYNQTGVGGTTTGATNRIYDLRGRYFYAGVVSRF